LLRIFAGTTENMETVIQDVMPFTTFSQGGSILLTILLTFAGILAVSAILNLFSSTPLYQRYSTVLLVTINIFFVMGFFWICWFHWQIYLKLPLQIPENLISWLNQQLAMINKNSDYGLPLVNIAVPPRYKIPFWIENEKYYFWFMCYGAMALLVHFRLTGHRLRALLHLFLSSQIAILYFFTDPFSVPLPQFFNEITPWFSPKPSLMAKAGYFMQLYPKMIFYYNAEYMWVHPPLLFISYAAISIIFITSVFMLVKRELEVEKVGYEYAKLGFFMLTLGMLLGYPWALKAWGPNWWWDPKICSSLMMWAVFLTYLHTRLYANKRYMWYFTSFLGILCFAAMIFTFITSFYFPGEHTFQ
jgi:ABC-type transport system involved in cytochrome c biogenesis permease subunit